MTHFLRRSARRQARDLRGAVRHWSGNGVTTRGATVVNMDVLRLPLKSHSVVTPSTHIVGVSPVNNTNTASA